jgi:hypothetical protein
VQADEIAHDFRERHQQQRRRVAASPLESGDNRSGHKQHTNPYLRDGDGAVFRLSPTMGGRYSNGTPPGALQEGTPSVATDHPLPAASSGCDKSPRVSAEPCPGGACEHQAALATLRREVAARRRVVQRLLVQAIRRRVRNRQRAHLFFVWVRVASHRHRVRVLFANMVDRRWRVSIRLVPPLARGRAVG